jgi:glucokinase
MILAGDIGGTKTNLGLFEVIDGALQLKRQQSFPSKTHSDLESIIAEFLRSSELSKDSILAACFGIAGPVIDGRTSTPNLPWIVDSRSLSRQLDLGSVRLMNDLESTGYGVAELKAGEFLTMNEGRPAEGNRALLAAGTGMGMASLFWTGKDHFVSPSEGGHADFAARTNDEIELLRFIKDKFERVSIERLLSGPGLFNIYDYLRHSGKYGSELPQIANRFKEEDPSSVISKAALSGECPMTVKALDMFVAIYGATAGNAALTLMATGGVYVGGGIAPKIKEKLVDGTFMSAFIDKGRLSDLMKTMPVHVILNDKTALLGAARVAASQL